MQKICRKGTVIPDAGARHVLAALDAADRRGIQYALCDLPLAL
jgi:hypothetical protein